MKKKERNSKIGNRFWWEVAELRAAVRETSESWTRLRLKHWLVPYKTLQQSFWQPKIARLVIKTVGMVGRLHLSTITTSLLRCPR